MVYETTNDDMMAGLRSGGFIGGGSNGGDCNATGGAGLISGLFNAQRNVTTDISNARQNIADSNELLFVGKKYRVLSSFSDKNSVNIPTGAILQIDRKISNSMGNIGSIYAATVLNGNTSYSVTVSNIDLINNTEVINRVKENMANNGKIFTVPAGRTVKTLDGSSIQLTASRKYRVYDDSVVQDNYGERRYMYGVDETTGEKMLIPQDLTTSDVAQGMFGMTPISKANVVNAREKLGKVQQTGQQVADFAQYASSTYNDITNNGTANNNQLPPCGLWTWFTGSPCDDGRPAESSDKTGGDVGGDVGGDAGGCGCGNIGPDTKTYGGAPFVNVDNLINEFSSMSKLQSAILLIECLIVIMLIILMINYNQTLKNITLISIVGLFVLMLVDYLNIF